jgi:molybdopterin synthase catalytic subunit
MMNGNRFAVSSAPIEAAAVAALANRGDPGGDGAVVLFIGRVRNEHLGRRVVALEYEAYEPMAVRVFARIADEAAAEWPMASLAIHHRVGRLAVGEVSVVIAAGSPHRAEAFAACRYAIERIKQVAPVWKREWFADGDAWAEGAAVDPNDEGARQVARQRACV